jgi:hypothetical protein
MAKVNVDTSQTKWGVTHLVTGSAADVNSWCRSLEKSTSYRVFCRTESKNADGTITWRADVDSSGRARRHNDVAEHVQQESSGPGFLACIAIGVGLGFLFGG